MLGQRLLPNHGDSLVWRKILFVILENGQIERGDQAIGHIARDQVHLVIFQGAREKAEIHDARWHGELQAVSCDQPFIAIRALHEFVAEAGTPLRSVLRGLRESLQMQAAGVVAANLDCKCIVEAERRSQCEMKAALVF